MRRCSFQPVPNKYRDFLVELLDELRHKTNHFARKEPFHFRASPMYDHKWLQANIPIQIILMVSMKLWIRNTQVSYRSSLTEHSPWNTHTENMSRTSLAFFMGNIWHGRGLTEATWRLVSFLIPGDRRNNRTGPCRRNYGIYDHEKWLQRDSSYLNWYPRRVLNDRKILMDLIIEVPISRASSEWSISSQIWLIWSERQRSCSWTSELSRNCLAKHTVRLKITNARDLEANVRARTTVCQLPLAL